MPTAWRPIFVSFPTTVPETSPGFNLDAYKGSNLEAIVRLPSDVKKIGAIKLVGCAQNMFGLAMLDIKEVATNNGALLTNENYDKTMNANGNFFAIPAYTAHPNSGLTSGSASTLWDSSAEGLRCVAFTPRNMTTLTFTLRHPVTNKPLTHGETMLSTVHGSANLTLTNGSNQCFLWLRILTECDD